MFTFTRTQTRAFLTSTTEAQSTRQQTPIRTLSVEEAALVSGGGGGFVDQTPTGARPRQPGQPGQPGPTNSNYF